MVTLHRKRINPMSRKPRLLIDNGCYHIVARGNNRQHLFQEPSDFICFLDLIRQAKNRCLSKLYHYCLMSRHIHLLLQIALRKTAYQRQKAYRNLVGLEHPYDNMLDEKLIMEAF
jgi:putative transposase